MPLEAVPLSVSWDGNLKISFLPSTTANPLSVAALNGSGEVDITYSLTTGGFTHTTTENSVDDARLTLKQTLSRPGTFTETLELQFVATNSATNDKARIALIEGTTGYLVYRYGIPNATAWTVGQNVDVFTIQTGKQRKDAPAANGLITVTQMSYLTQPTQLDQPLVA